MVQPYQAGRSSLLVVLALLMASVCAAAVTTETRNFPFYGVNPSNSGQYLTGNVTLTGPQGALTKLSTVKSVFVEFVAFPSLQINRAWIHLANNASKTYISAVSTPGSAIWTKQGSGDPWMTNYPPFTITTPAPFGLYQLDVPNQNVALYSFKCGPNPNATRSTAGALLHHLYSDSAYSPFESGCNVNLTNVLSVDSQIRPYGSFTGAVVSFTSGGSIHYATESQITFDTPSSYDPVLCEGMMCAASSVTGSGPWHLTWKKGGKSFSGTANGTTPVSALPQPAKAQAEDLASVQIPSAGVLPTTTTTNVTLASGPNITFEQQNQLRLYGEPYTDTNGNGSRDPGEPYTDLDGNGSWTPATGGAGVSSSMNGDQVIRVDTSNARSNSGSFISGQRMDTTVDMSRKVMTSNTTAPATVNGSTGESFDLNAGLTQTNASGQNAQVAGDSVMERVKTNAVKSEPDEGSDDAVRDAVGRLATHAETTSANEAVAGNETLSRQRRPAMNGFVAVGAGQRQAYVAKDYALTSDDEPMELVLQSITDMSQKQSTIYADQRSAILDLQHFVVKNLDGQTWPVTGTKNYAKSELLPDMMGPSNASGHPGVFSATELGLADYVTVAVSGQPVPGDVVKLDTTAGDNPVNPRPSNAFCGAPFYDLDGDGDLDRHHSDDPFDQEFDQMRLIWHYGHEFKMFKAKWWGFFGGKKSTGGRGGDMDKYATFCLIGYDKPNSAGLRTPTPILVATDPISYNHRTYRSGFLGFTKNWMYRPALTDFVDALPPAAAGLPNRIRFGMRYVGATPAMIDDVPPAQILPDPVGAGTAMTELMNLLGDKLRIDQSGAQYNNAASISDFQEYVSNCFSTRAAWAGYATPANPVTLQGTLTEADCVAANVKYNTYCQPGRIVLVTKTDPGGTVLGQLRYPVGEDVLGPLVTVTDPENPPANYVPGPGVEGYIAPAVKIEKEYGPAPANAHIASYTYEIQDPILWSRVVVDASHQTTSCVPVFGFTPLPGITFTQSIPVEVTHQLTLLPAGGQPSQALPVGQDVTFGGNEQFPPGLYRWPAGFDAYVAPEPPDPYADDAVPNKWTFDYPTNGSRQSTLAGGVPAFPLPSGPFTGSPDLNASTPLQYMTWLVGSGLNNVNYDANRLSFNYHRGNQMGRNDPYVMCKFNVPMALNKYIDEMQGKSPRVNLSLTTLLNSTSAADTLVEFFLKSTTATGDYSRLSAGGWRWDGDCWFDLDEGYGSYFFAGAQHKYENIIQQRDLLQIAWKFYVGNAPRSSGGSHDKSLCIEQFFNNTKPLSNHVVDGDGNITAIGNRWLSEARYLTQVQPKGFVVKADANGDRAQFASFTSPGSNLNGFDMIKNMSQFGSSFGSMFDLSGSSASGVDMSQAIARRQQMIDNPVYVFSGARGREWELDMARRMPTNIKLLCVEYDSQDDFTVAYENGDWRRRFPTIPAWMYKEDASKGVVQIRGVRSCLAQVGRNDVQFARTDKTVVTRLVQKPNIIPGLPPVTSEEKIESKISDEYTLLAQYSKIFFESGGDAYAISHSSMNGASTFSINGSGMSGPRVNDSQSTWDSRNGTADGGSMSTGQLSAANASFESSKSKIAQAYDWPALDDDAKSASRVPWAHELPDGQIGRDVASIPKSQTRVVFKHPMLMYYYEQDSLSHLPNGTEEVQTRQRNAATHAMTGPPVSTTAVYSAVFIRYGLECEPEQLFGKAVSAGPPPVVEWQWEKHWLNRDLAAAATYDRALTAEEARRVRFEEWLMQPLIDEQLLIANKDKRLLPSQTNPRLEQIFNEINPHTFALMQKADLVKAVRAVSGIPPQPPQLGAEPKSKPMPSAPVKIPPPADTVAPADVNNVNATYASAVPVAEPTVPAAPVQPPLLPWTFEGVTYTTAPTDPGSGPPVATDPGSTPPANNPPPAPGAEPLRYAQPVAPSLPTKPIDPGLGPNRASYSPSTLLPQPTNPTPVEPTLVSSPPGSLRNWDSYPGFTGYPLSTDTQRWAPNPNPLTDIASYTFCALEDQAFALPGVCDVAYGESGQYVFLAAQSGTITFSNAVFGDPIVNTPKKGYYRPNSVSSPAKTYTPQIWATPATTPATWAAIPGVLDGYSWAELPWASTGGMAGLTPIQQCQVVTGGGGPLTVFSPANGQLWGVQPHETVLTITATALTNNQELIAGVAWMDDSDFHWTGDNPWDEGASYGYGNTVITFGSPIRRQNGTLRTCNLHQGQVGQYWLRSRDPNGSGNAVSNVALWSVTQAKYQWYVDAFNERKNAIDLATASAVYQIQLAAYNTELTAYNAAWTAWNQHKQDFDQATALYSADWAIWQDKITALSDWNANVNQLMSQYNVDLAAWQQRERQWTDWNTATAAFANYPATYAAQLAEYNARKAAWDLYSTQAPLWQAKAHIWEAWLSHQGSGSGYSQDIAAEKQRQEAAAEHAHWVSVQEKFKAWQDGQASLEKTYRKRLLEYYLDQGDIANYNATATTLIGLGEYTRPWQPDNSFQTFAYLKTKWDQAKAAYDAWAQAYGKDEEVLKLALDGQALREEWCAMVSGQLGRALVGWDGDTHVASNFITGPSPLVTSVNDIIGVMPVEWLVDRGMLTPTERWQVDYGGVPNLNWYLINNRGTKGESYTDTDGNGAYDAGEPFSDSNGDGSYTGPRSGDGDRYRNTYSGPAPKVRRLAIWQAYGWFLNPANTSVGTLNQL